jgi:hypothetical protein
VASFVTELLLRLEEPVPPPYVARRPEWSDVVRGASDEVRFLERTITNELTTSMQAALGEAKLWQGKLRTQFVTGAPGSGKSTLVLRVAAKLVLDGDCVVVDARYSLADDDDLEGFQTALEKLAEGKRPVLLLLDDPLGGDSVWPRLLKKLARAGVRRWSCSRRFPIFCSNAIVTNSTTSASVR